MAKKPRTPQPPRKVQAPQVRHKASTSSSVSLPWTNVLIGAATVAVIALVIALFVLLSGEKAAAQNVTTKDVAKVSAAMTAAGCTFKTSLAEASNQHVGTEQPVEYETFPATSGRHRSDTAIWGNYRNPADPRQAVHNLEHGGIAIWYGADISAEDRAALDAFYDEDPNGLLISPLDDTASGVTYPEHDRLGGGIALTVWTADAGKPDSGQTRIAICPTFSPKAFAAFRDAFRGKGPERFPVSEMVPGVS